LKNPRPVTPLVGSETEGALKLRLAVQGGSRMNTKLYDLTISNESDKQKLLTTFHVRWINGCALCLSGGASGQILAPQEAYSVTVTGPANADDIDYEIKEDFPISPAILLPPKNESGPSVSTIRLEVLLEQGHNPYSDWETLYEISVEAD